MPAPIVGRSAALAGLLAAAVLVGGCGGGDGSSTTGQETTQTSTHAETTPAKPVVVTVTVRNAAPVGGIKRASVTKGDRVDLVVRSDVADEIHLHGYNLMQDVAAGGTARISFVATVPGRFEAELEQRGVQIADLTVNP